MIVCAVRRDQGLVDYDVAAHDRIPREMKRAWLSFIDRLGNGAFGEVRPAATCCMGAWVHGPRHPAARCSVVDLDLPLCLRVGNLHKPGGSN